MKSSGPPKARTPNHAARAPGRDPSRGPSRRRAGRHLRPSARDEPREGAVEHRVREDVKRLGADEERDGRGAILRARDPEPEDEDRNQRAPHEVGVRSTKQHSEWTPAEPASSRARDGCRGRRPVEHWRSPPWSDGARGSVCSARRWRSSRSVFRAERAHRSGARRFSARRRRRRRCTSSSNRSSSMAVHDRWSTVRYAVADVARAVTLRAKVGVAVFPPFDDEESCNAGAGGRDPTPRRGGRNRTRHRSRARGCHAADGDDGRARVALSRACGGRTER